MKSMNRLHLYPHSEPNGRAYIVADKQGLKDMAKILIRAADSVVGMETITLYGSDGHPYELFVVANVQEDEWQIMPLPAADHAYPATLAIIQTYANLKQTV